MTESFVTQCPHCQTRFRVTRTQLGMANGAVRCGACLQVFNAAAQLADAGALAPGDDNLGRLAAGTQAAGLAGLAAAGSDSHSAPAAATAAEPMQPAGYTPAPPQTPPSEREPVGKPAADEEPLWIHDDLDLDNLDLDAELAKLEQDEFELEHRQEPRTAPAATSPRRHAALEAHDESWVEALLNEPDTPATSARPRAIEEPPLALEASDEDFPDLEDDAQEVAAHRRDALTAERDAPIAASLGAAQRSEPRLRDESLRHLSDEPLQLERQAPQRSWIGRLLWPLLVLLALAGLAGQYAWYHFDELARDERLRPWFERLCPALGCSLPPRVDVGLVKSSNLTVRSHPSRPGALSVDAILYNRADFAQPFPLLELRFEDINGRPLASRRFKPSEYLAGELAGQTDMPPQTPIHIGLEILDPGLQAVNYSLSFHSPD